MKRTALTILLFLAALLTACQSEPKGEISLSNESARFDSGGGTVEFSVTANYNWTCNSGTPDLVYSTRTGQAGSTTMTVSVPGNPDAEERTIEIKFNCEDAKAVLTIIQEGSVFTVLKITHDAKEFDVPCFIGTGFGGTADWGDGQTDIFSSVSELPSHEYKEEKTHEVTISVHDSEAFTLQKMSGVKKIDLTQF